MFFKSGEITLSRLVLTIHRKENTMQQDKEIVDVEFTEIKKEEGATASNFNPAVFLTQALIDAGLIDEATKWSIGIDPRAETAESEKDRIFFANRALRLFLAEVEGRDNVTPRMLLADGIDAVKWMALMEQGVIPWLLNQFDKKGKRIAPEEQKEEFAGNTGESDVASQINQPVEGNFVEQPPVWQGSADQAPVVVGIDLAAEGSVDQTTYASTNAVVAEGEDGGCDAGQISRDPDCGDN